MNDLVTQKSGELILDKEILDASKLRMIQAALICEYGNMGWTFENRCELNGACPGCQERALKVMPDKPKTSEDYFNVGSR